MSKPKRVLIGFAGPIGSGKDTMARAMADIMHGRVFKFAQPLYDMAQVIDPAFHPNMPHKDKVEFVLGRKELGTRRNFLQMLGTEFGRNMIYSDIWNTIQDDLLSKYEGPVFYSDVRFENEAAFIRNKGGHIIHLRCNWVMPTTPEANLHTSEKGVGFVAGDSIIGLSEGKIQKGAKEVLGVIEDIFYLSKASRLD